MLAEVLVRSAFHLLGNHAPDGRRYWAARYWDRTQAEEPPELAVHYTTEKQEIRSLIAKYATDAGTILEIACGPGGCVKAPTASRSPSGRPTCGRPATSGRMTSWCASTPSTTWGGSPMCSAC